MWLFLSRRLRTWVLLGIAVPIVRGIVRRVAASRAASHPDARSTAALQRADGALARVQRKRRRSR